MQGQDWNQVVFHKNKPRPNVDRPSTMSEATGKPVWKVEKAIENGENPIKYVSNDDAKKIIQGRVAAKLTQKQLAMKVNMQEKDIKEIESSKAVENKQVLSRIFRVLGIQK
jgi:ribosome-binding protein aMBF1 (putative translation factor)